MNRPLGLALAIGLFAAPLAAKDSLGMFETWGAFRDPTVPRCYAIAMPIPSRASREYRPFATVSTWPRRGVRGQVHFRLSRKMASQSQVTLSLGGKKLVLAGGGGDAWAQDKAMDAAIVAAMRSARSMTLSARDARGRRFSDVYLLEGAATAMDAATIGCARINR